MKSCRPRPLLTASRGPRGRRIPSTPEERPVAEHIVHDHADDGMDRRGFLRCMAWTGTGMLWVMRGGVLGSATLAGASAASDAAAAVAGADLFFLQISDSHIGFGREANPDVGATLQAAVDRINA